MCPLEKRSGDARQSPGELIIEARKRAGLTESEMARKLELDEVTYRAYEKDIVEPPPSALRRIAHLLSIDPKEIPHAYARYSQN